MDTAIKLGVMLIEAIPKIIKAIKSGKDPSEIKLGDVVSRDALAKLKSIKSDADDFISHG